MADQLMDASENIIEPKPFWLPADVALDDLPDELRTAVLGILTPAYQNLVAAARPGLEQSTGMTIVNLLWLEILQQVELGRDLTKGGARTVAAASCREIDRPPVAAGRLKLKASDFRPRLGAGRRKLMERLGVAVPAEGRDARRRRPVLHVGRNLTLEKCAFVDQKVELRFHKIRKLCSIALDSVSPARERCVELAGLPWPAFRAVFLLTLPDRGAAVVNLPRSIAVFLRNRCGACSWISSKNGGSARLKRQARAELHKCKASWQQELASTGSESQRV